MPVSIFPPFPRFDDADGQPLDGGFLYLGTANLDPVANPIAVFFDAALTVSAPNPVRTSGGFIVDGSGSSQNLYCATDFSIIVADRQNNTLYSAPSYGFRIFSDAITFNTVIIGTSIVPDAAGGATSGSTSLPWSTTTTRDLQAKTATVYDTAQPSVAADLAKVKQLAVVCLCCKQVSSGATASLTNIKNTASITRTAAGLYDVVPTVALPANAYVGREVSFTSTETIRLLSYATTLIQIQTQLGGVNTDLPFDLIVFGNPAVADPIS